MCGLIAIIGYDGSIEPGELATMNAAIHHRGPDDSGCYLDHLETYSVALGHLRLAVIDPSSKGHQPMGLCSAETNAATVTEDDKLDLARFVIAYNGEIYNFKDLRRSLSECGWSFESGTDTEVLLKGYAQWGNQVVDRLVGMFAFVIYDRDKGRVMVARDFPGIKPMYVYRTERRIYFASEAKSFAEFNLPVNNARVHEYQISKYISTESMHCDVQCVAPGSLLDIDLGARTIKERRYSTLTSVLDTKAYAKRALAGERQLIDDLDELLNEVVSDQMVADVPVGTICSGGIDSSLVTAIAAKLKPSLKIFSLDVDGTSEIEYARRVANHLDLDLCEVPFGKHDFDKLAPRSTYYKDTPLVHPNSVAILKLSQTIKKSDVTVILSGEGADEVFGGYQKYVDYNRVLHLRRFLPRLNKALIPLIGDENTVRAMVDHEVTPVDLWRIWPASDGRIELQETLRDQYLAAGESRIGAEVSSLIAKDIQYYLNPLLRRADRMTMAVGIEGRVPMLDQRVIEFGINLPTRYKVRFLQGGKYLLKKVADRYLPKDIVWRKKKGLPIPVAEWTGLTSKLEQKNFFLDLWLRNSRS